MSEFGSSFNPSGGSNKFDYSLLDSLPNEEVANRLKAEYRNVCAALESFEMKMRQGKTQAVYVCAKLWQEHHTLVAEIQRYNQMHSDSANLISDAFRSLNDQSMQEIANFMASVLNTVKLEVTDRQVATAIARQMQGLSNDLFAQLLNVNRSQLAKLNAAIEGED